jgi:NAD(P)-dependent dehydrogenase (short-subunit alcohol dehydrogenase family)
MGQRRFEGKKVVVVASGFGVDGPEDIGRAAAIQFAAEGAEVAIAEAKREYAEDCAEQIRAMGGTCHVFENDPRDPEQVAELGRRVGALWDHVDVLLTHHFGATFGDVEATSVADFEEVVRVNLTGVFAATKAFLPLLRAAGSASIVHAGSIDGTFGNPNVMTYSASKGGVHALVHVLAGQLAHEGIRVNAIGRAGSTEMPLADNVFAELDRATPLRGAADPREYAKAMLFLASDDASYITGAVLPVDGGRTAVTPGCSPGYTGYTR